MGATVKGAKATLRGVKDGQDKANLALLKAIRMEAAETLRESLAEVPRDTGFLANSSKTEKIRRQIAVRVVFEADYAFYVHEADPSVQFTVGKRKFLEDPVKRRASGYAERIARTVRAELK